MNVDTGHLVRLREILGEELESSQNEKENFIDEVKQLREDYLKEVARAKGYEPVPARMQEQAVVELDGKKETVVNLQGDSELAKWASMKREQKKRKNKRKMVNASKRRNR